MTESKRSLRPVRIPKAIGFGAEVTAKEERNVGEVLKQVMPEDFIKFGLIPEFIGRVLLLSLWTDWMKKL